ncbi:MAG: hypothetical protein K9N46_16680 [Candidatus Marinimicrobia bacterium]|nr:hypothetical protein [Candidatus Neomarinimicrobiota bacterium]MCF7830063.1 hypothetical protein [Candidatus Neomarinimicrobiota bacterium]MCF7882364.1 hypothetical protein [Candidatus Neomarinimicrobiota bacterium]
MKKVIVFFCLLVIAIPLMGQEETLLGEDLEHGGFGGPVIKMTAINGDGAVMTGGRGGWIVNHSLVLGGGSYSMVNEFTSNGLDYDFDYSGLEMEYIGRPMDLFHYSAYLLVGRGDIRRQTDNGNLTDFLRSDGVFVMAPEVNAVANVSEHFHMALGVGYRLVNGVDVASLTDGDLSGLSATLTFEFGKF